MTISARYISFINCTLSGSPRRELYADAVVRYRSTISIGACRHSASGAGYSGMSMALLDSHELREHIPRSARAFFPLAIISLFS